MRWQGAYERRINSTFMIIILKMQRNLEQEGYGKVCRDIKEATDHAELIILAVKPQNVKEVGNLIGQELKKEQVVISLLAGTSIESLKGFFPQCTHCSYDA